MNLNPVFLTLDEILEIHKDQIDRHGGSLGLRDMHLLESAIGMPMTGFGELYLHNDIFEMAAAYLFHLVQNHPFVDGNKRTGAVVAFVFLKMNGFTLSAVQHDYESLVRSVAQGKVDKTTIAKFVRAHCKS
jgi:death-on-curing protein